MEDITMTAKDIEIVSWNLSNFTYHGNLKATEQLMELFDNIVDRFNNKVAHRTLNTPEDYIRMYDDNFYTYQTWEALVESEAEQNNGLTEEECKEELNHTIFQLPCGWYVQYV
jgi:hypothetical protein